MPDLNNLTATDQADFIRDDAEPALRLRNVSTGPGLHSEALAVTSSASVDVANIGGPILAANASITNLNIVGASRASGAVLALVGDAYTSVGSIDFAAGSDWAGTGAIRVVNSDGTFSWIPLLPDAALEDVSVPA